VKTSLSEILEEELLYWIALEDGEPDQRKKYIIHGGKCEVLFLRDLSSQINREFLLARHKEVRDRKVNTKLYELMVASKERDEKRMEAIVRIGTKLKSVV
jgi:hypothetical protein